LNCRHAAFKSGENSGEDSVAVRKPPDEPRPPPPPPLLLPPAPP